MSPEVVVVGAGPAGMAAASALARHEVEVLVVDEQHAPGGRIYRAIEKVAERRAEDLALLGDEYRSGAALVAEFRAAGAGFAPATSVWELGAHQGGPSLAIADRDGVRNVAPRHVIVATGAMERPTPFPGWTLPGVMGVGAAQILLKDSDLVGDGRVVIAGTGPLAYLFAHQMIQAGSPPAMLLDTGPRRLDTAAFAALLPALPGSAGDLLKGIGWMRGLARAGVRRLTGVRELSAIGQRRIEAVEYRRNGRWERTEADLLLVHDGVIPSAHLAMAAGCEHRWYASQRYWVPVLDGDGLSTRPGISIVGDAGGIGGAAAAALRGTLVGAAVARELGRLDAGRYTELAVRTRNALRPLAWLRRFLDTHYRPTPAFLRPADPATPVCRCEEVTAGEIRAVAELGCVGPNQGKAFTRCGMGPCMGRECGNAVSELIAEHHGLPMDEVGHYRIRPPVRPITVGQLADLSTGDRPRSS